MPTGPQGPNGTYLTKPMESPLRFHHTHMAHLFASGMTPTEVAEYTGFSCVQVTKILAAPLFQKEIARLQKDAEAKSVDLREALSGLALKALCNLEEDLHISDGKEPNEMTTPERRMRQAASFDVLDRIGLGKKELHVGELHLHKHEEQHIHNMSETELRNDVLDLLRG